MPGCMGSLHTPATAAAQRTATCFFPSLKLSPLLCCLHCRCSVRAGHEPPVGMNEAFPMSVSRAVLPLKPATLCMCDIKGYMGVLCKVWHPVTYREAS